MNIHLGSFESGQFICIDFSPSHWLQPNRNQSHHSPRPIGGTESIQSTSAPVPVPAVNGDIQPLHEIRPVCPSLAVGELAYILGLPYILMFLPVLTNTQNVQY